MKTEIKVCVLRRYVKRRMYCRLLGKNANLKSERLKMFSTEF